jgi:hypothetical protein
MRKSSPRLLAGLVVLGMFAFVGMFTAGAFANNVREVSAPQSATESNSELKTKIFHETRSSSQSNS